MAGVRGGAGLGQVADEEVAAARRRRLRAPRAPETNGALDVLLLLLPVCW